MAFAGTGTPPPYLCETNALPTALSWLATTQPRRIERMAGNSTILPRFEGELLGRQGEGFCEPHLNNQYRGEQASVHEIWERHEGQDGIVVAPRAARTFWLGSPQDRLRE